MSLTELLAVGDTEGIVKALFNALLHTDDSFVDALNTVTRFGTLDTIKVVFQRLRADISLAEVVKACHIAVEEEGKDVVEYLVENHDALNLLSNVPIEFRPKVDARPLFLAARTGKLNFLKYFIAKNSDLKDATNYDHHTVIAVACKEVS